MIIGISGPTGSGKDTAANFIEKEFHFKHISGGDVLRDLLRRIGFEPKKEAVGDLGTLLRINYGSDAILKLVMDQGGSGNIIISGFRSPEEAKLIKQAGGVIIYIEAREETRHQRVITRSRESEDSERIKAIEKKESQSSNKLAESLIDIRSISDAIILNDSSVEDFYEKLKDIVPLLVKSATSGKSSSLVR